MYGSGKVKSRVYTPQDNIDYFILVTLYNEEIFIVPFNSMVGRKNIYCSIDGFGWNFHNKFEYFK